MAKKKGPSLVADVVVKGRVWKKSALFRDGIEKIQAHGWTSEDNKYAAFHKDGYWHLYEVVDDEGGLNKLCSNFDTFEDAIEGSEKHRAMK